MSAEDVRQPSHGRKPKFIAILLGTLTVVFLCGIVALMGMKRHLDQQVLLLDGRVLTVNDVTFGRKANYDSSTPRWEWLTGSKPLADLPSDTLSVWLSIRNSVRQTPVAFTSFGMVAIVDAHNHRFPYAVASASDVPNIPLPFVHTGTVTRLDFPNFPRREKRLHLQLWDMRGAVLGECVVPNPGFVTPREFTPERLPAMHQVGDLSVTLRSVKWNPDAVRILYNGVSFDKGDLVIDWACSQGGRPLDSWQDVAGTLTDATGNTTHIHTYSPGEIICPDEPAYRLHMRLARKVDAPFSANETWTMSGISVPASGKMQSFHTQHTLAGVALTLHSLTVAPKVTYTKVRSTSYVQPDSLTIVATGMPDRRWSQGFLSGSSSGINPIALEVRGSAPQLAVGVGGLREDQRLTIWATDAHARRYNESPLGPTVFDAGSNPHQSADKLQVHMIAIPSGIKKVDLHFCVQTLRDVEFTISPEIASKIGRK